MIYSHQETDNYKESSSIDEEIDLKKILGVIYRKKSLVFTSSILLTFVFFGFAKIKEKTWQGYFEIVLSSKSSNTGRLSSFLNMNPNIPSGIFSLPNRRDDLKTQVKILESPAVLMPVFDYVKSEKIKINKKYENNFLDWKEKSLDIDLFQGTSVLKIFYEDKNKDLVLPVLKKISDEYKLFSQKNKRKNMNSTKNYLDEQIKFYKEKSSKSLKIAQEYAMDNDLEVYGDLSTLANGRSSISLNNQPESILESSGGAIYNNSDIELIRVQASNKIRKIDTQIEKIKNLSDDMEQIEYLSSTNKLLAESSLYEDLLKIDSELIDYKSKYKSSDPTLKLLAERKANLISSLKDKTIGYLLAEKISLESLMESSIRPKDVLLTYKEYIREAVRDEKTLINLENNLRLLMLEDAKIENPWELIYQPTLKKYPVKPKILIYSLFGFLTGFLVSVAYALYLDKKKGIIFYQKTLEEKLNVGVIDKINIDTLNSSNKSNNQFFLDFLNVNKKEEIELIVTNQINLENIKKFFENNSEKLSIKKIDEDFSNFKKTSLIILCTSLGKISTNEIKNTLKKLSLYELSLNSILLLED